MAIDDAMRDTNHHRRGRNPMDISRTKPHARSYRPDLPLAGYTDAQLLKITAEDKATYAALPITLRDMAPDVAERVATLEERASYVSATHAPKARALFVTMNVNDETSASGQTAVPCIDGHRHAWQTLTAQSYAPSQRFATDFYRDGDTYTCAHCDTLVTVGPSRIAPTPKIPCPYAARNRREEKGLAFRPAELAA